MKRLERTPEEERRPRVPAAEWPEGKRWCAGCQWMIPLDYCSGSRCRACASQAAHASRVKSVYDLDPVEERRLLAWQAGRCYVCGRRSGRRLAVDHDHATGTVRGLLCPDQERGCNHKVLGLLEANCADGALAGARRLVAYLEMTPLERMRAGHTPVPEAPDTLSLLQG